MSGGAGIIAAGGAIWLGWTPLQTFLWGAGVAIVVASYLLWAEERKKVVALDRDELVEARRLALARLRQAGVALRNSAQFGFEEAAAMQAWMEQVETWNTEVVFSIMAGNEADAEWFRIADVVETPRIPMSYPWDTPLSGDEHAFFLYNLHDFRLVKLEKLILAYGKI